MKSCHYSQNVDEVNVNTEQLKDISLENTKWAFRVADDCINYLLFLEDSVSIYVSCETDDETYGKYFVQADTLYIHENLIKSNSSSSENECGHSSEQAKYKLVLSSGKLKHIERWSFSEVKDLWIKDNFGFDDDYLFEKVK